MEALFIPKRFNANDIRNVLHAKPCSHLLHHDVPHHLLLVPLHPQLVIVIE